MTQNDEDPPLSERIKAERTRLGLSQEDFAAALGTSRTHVNRWEKGKHSPEAAYQVKLAELTGKPSAYFEPSPDEKLTPLYRRLQSELEALQAELASERERREHLEALVREHLGLDERGGENVST